MRILDARLDLWSTWLNVMQIPLAIAPCCAQMPACAPIRVFRIKRDNRRAGSEA
jgi:hypothetical protein